MQTSKTSLLSQGLQSKDTFVPMITPDKKEEHYKSAAILLNKRKQLHPLDGNPYNSKTQCYMHPIHLKQCNDSAFVQRIVSAKMLRIKTLQNQLTDAHYHLNELATENKLLKTLQKRQDSALRKYEGTNAELPIIINTYHEELRVMQSKYKKLKLQHMSNCKLLKEKEIKIQIMQDQNKHLLQLSKDQNLEERESLKLKVSDLNYKVEQQDKTINTLNRKLTIETKYLKHQLHLEVMKHKETQKKLKETLKKLKSAEELLESKEKKLMHGKQLNLLRTMQNIREISHSHFNNNRLGILDGDNLNTSKVPLNNLENKKDTFIIEDVEKMTEQLNLSKVLKMSDSISTISQCRLTKMMERKDENRLPLESFESAQNKTVINGQDIEIDNSHNTNCNYVNCGIKDSVEVSLVTTTESVSSLENEESISSQKQKLHVKYSISEESEPEDFTEVNSETKSEFCDDSYPKNDCTENLVAQKKINYDKEKLLAVMKAIDDNENIEYVGHKTTHSSQTELTERSCPAVTGSLEDHWKIIENLLDLMILRISESDDSVISNNKATKLKCRMSDIHFLYREERINIIRHLIEMFQFFKYDLVKDQTRNFSN